MPSLQNNIKLSYDPRPWAGIFFCSDQLSRQFQLLLRGKASVEFLKGLRLPLRGEVALRRGVFPGDAAEIPGDQLPAQEEGVVRSLRQVVVADAELPGVSKAAFAVEEDVPQPSAAAFSRE